MAPGIAQPPCSWTPFLQDRVGLCPTTEHTLAWPRRRLGAPERWASGEGCPELAATSRGLPGQPCGTTRSQSRGLGEDGLTRRPGRTSGGRRTLSAPGGRLLDGGFPEDGQPGAKPWIPSELHGHMDRTQGHRDTGTDSHTWIHMDTRHTDTHEHTRTRLLHTHGC